MFDYILIQLHHPVVSTCEIASALSHSRSEYSYNVKVGIPVHLRNPTGHPSFWRCPEFRQQLCLQPLLDASLIKMFAAWVLAAGRMAKLRNIASL